MLLVTLILIWVSSHFLSCWLNCSTRFSFWTTTASTLRSYERDFDNRQLLAHFYHSHLLFPFLSSQRFFSFSGWMKAGSTRYLLPEIKRNSRIWFAVEYKHSSLEAYLTMPMYCNDLTWASLQLLSSTATDPGHLSKCSTSFPPCLLHPQHYKNIFCSIACCLPLLKW